MTKSIVNSGFIGIYKLGDNVNHNLDILKQLYSYEINGILNKPKTIFIVSIIEAVLYDFYFKVKFYTIEGIKNLPQNIMDYLRGKSADRLYHYINLARNKEIFGRKNESIYDDLDLLRKLRNRIHIQNEKNQLESNDRDAFTNDRRNLAERTLSFLLKHMDENHDRGHTYVNNFILPWKHE